MGLMEILLEAQRLLTDDTPLWTALAGAGGGGGLAALIANHMARRAARMTPPVVSPPPPVRSEASIPPPPRVEPPSFTMKGEDVADLRHALMGLRHALTYGRSTRHETYVNFLLERGHEVPTSVAECDAAIGRLRDA